MVRAAIVRAAGGPLRFGDIELPEPGYGQVRVRLAAAGVCHSDLSLLNGTLPQPMPAVLGHEGSGTVVAVGEGVSVVAPGDPVLLNCRPACRTCRVCAAGQPYLCPQADVAATKPYTRLPDGTPLYPGLGMAAFAEETVVPAAGVIPLPADVPLDTAAVLGCAVLTGFGAVVNCARVRRGESVVVYGAGGVGLSVLQAARITGAEPIVAVDVSTAKEELARAQGASEFVLAGTDTVERVRALTGGYGADHAIECVGRPETIRLAWSSTRHGGCTTVVGAGAKGDQVSFSARELFATARTLRGCLLGNGDPVRDIALLVEHVRAGRLRLDMLITDRIGLSEVPAAFDRMSAGRGARSLIIH